jgi:hypothetical protein
MLWTFERESGRVKLRASEDSPRVEAPGTTERPQDKTRAPSNIWQSLGISKAPSLPLHERGQERRRLASALVERTHSLISR